MIVDGAKILEQIPEDAWRVGIYEEGDPDGASGLLDNDDRTRLVHLIADLADQQVEAHLAAQTPRCDPPAP